MREDSSENMSLLANYRATRGEANDGYRSSSREPNCFTFNQSLQQPFSTSSYFSTGSSSISQPGSSLTSTPAGTPSDCSPENQRNNCKSKLTNSCKPLPLTITIMLILSLVGVITLTRHHSSSSSSIEPLHSVSPESLQGSPDLSLPINESLAVQTECGKYIGLTEDDGYVFKGIRYGVAPIGSLRWSSTQPIWVDSAYCDAKSLKRAIKFGPSCFQINPYTKKYQGSEDCLFLNVWTPTLNDSVSE